MKVSYEWLQSFFDEKLPPPAAVADLLIAHAFEVESVEEKDGDSILDVKVLPNRAHDCLSHLGIAREVSLASGLTCRKPAPRAIAADSPRSVSLSIMEPDACDRYIGRVVEGITVGPSPAWLSRRLAAVGQRSINNVVDCANYVMLSVGQPLHAFDADAVESLAVRFARAGERMTTLDGKEVSPDTETLVIADGDRLLALAGIKGGTAAEIGPATKNIIIEAAHFNPTNIRRSSFRLGLRTDASHRFENEPSPALAEYASDLMTGMVIELAGGRAGTVIDVDHTVPRKAPGRVTARAVNALLGTSFGEREVTAVQERISYEFRMDLERPADMIEEVGRILGYDRAPAAPTTEIFPDPQPLPAYYYAEFLRAHLAARGYTEIMTYAFAARGVRALKNPLQKDRGFVRDEISAGVLDKLTHNRVYADLLGRADVKVFEIGTVFLEDREEVRCAIASSGTGPVAEDIPWPVANLYDGRENCIEFCLDDVTANLPVPDSYQSLPPASLATVQYRSWSPFPHAVRDIALFVPPETEEDDIVTLVEEAAGSLLARPPRRFDRFEKRSPDGTVRVSYAYRLVFQAADRTLTAEEVQEIMSRITAAIAARGDWQVR